MVLSIVYVSLTCTFNPQQNRIEYNNLYLSSNHTVTRKIGTYDRTILQLLISLIFVVSYYGHPLLLFQVLCILIHLAVDKSHFIRFILRLSFHISYLFDLCLRHFLPLSSLSDWSLTLFTNAYAHHIHPFSMH